MPTLDARLDPAHDQEGGGDKKQAEADLAERRDVEKAVADRVDAESEDRHHDQDQESIGGLNLGRQHGKTPAQVLVHQVGGGLQSPGLAIALIPQRPEHRDKQVHDQQAPDQFQSGRGNQIAEPLPAGRRHHREALAPQEEHQRRDCHHHRRKAEGGRRAVVFQQHRTKDDRDRGAGIDRQIKIAEGTLDQVLVAVGELIAHIGRHAGLDAPGPEGHEAEADGERDRGLRAQCEHGAAQHIDDRKNDDRAVLAPEHVGNDGADQRKKIRPGLEQTLPAGGTRLPEVQRAGHVHRQDRVDAVITEALRKLVGNDERDTLGHPVGIARVDGLDGAVHARSPRFCSTQGLRTG